MIQAQTESRGEKGVHQPGAEFLKEFQTFLTFLQNLWGLLAGVSIFFPFSNLLLKAIPLRAYGEEGGVYNHLSPPLLTTATTIVTLFVLLSTFTGRGRLCRRNSRRTTVRNAWISFAVSLSVLPMFHSFGLTIGALLPLLYGIKAFFYPSPLHYRTIPEMAYRINATLLCGTNTFLSGYARRAHPYDFYRLRYVFAGAEKLQEDTRQAWMEKFGVRLLEGYGMTEAGPVLAVNTPLEYRAGSVGRFLPGIEWYLDPVPALPEGGRLCVRGPNVMLGYLRPGTAGQLTPASTTRGAGWYDTGDLVRVDQDGFVRVLGRARRFAKIGGEMVSLAAVEEFVLRTWPRTRHAVMSVPDPQAGEQLVLLTEHSAATRQALVERARLEGASNLIIPKRILTVPALPLLTNGKIDYPAARALAGKMLAHRQEAALSGKP